MYTTNLRNQLVIDDSNYRSFVRDRDGGAAGVCSYESRPWDQYPLGFSKYSRQIPFPLIPRSEWADRIEEKERTMSTLWHIRQAYKLRTLNQSRTNLCWANAPVGAVENLYAYQGHIVIPLSAASVACPITGFKNVGGWPTRAFDGMSERGVVPEPLWPANEINRRYDNEESRKVAANYKVPDIYDMKPDNFDLVMTVLLHDLPVVVGLMWWRHAVYYNRPVVLGRDSFGVGMVNSWGDNWEDNGEAVLAEGKATPDEAVAPAVIAGDFSHE